MNQLVQPKDSSTFLLVAVETAPSPPIRELQAVADDALRPRYAFFLFPTFPLLWNPLRCIAPARDIVLVSLTTFRTVTYMLFYSKSGTITSGRSSVLNFPFPLCGSSKNWKMPLKISTAFIWKS